MKLLERAPVDARLFFFSNFNTRRLLETSLIAVSKQKALLEQTSNHKWSKLRTRVS